MLEGPGAVGKTEAWYVLEAAADAEILLGVRPSVPPEAVRGAIRDGAVADLLERRRVTAGEAYLVPAGTLHAVGPGALMYEIQQPSDITYRCDDWGRPAGPDRPLHTDQALACVRATPWTSRVRKGPVGGAREEVVGCDRFVLEGLRPGPARPVRCDTMAASVHVLTTAAGSAVVAGNGWVEPLDLFETLVVPADAGRYTVAAPGSEGTLVLLARLPSPGEP
jgi:mannose-6-phosphate isomerase